MAEIKFACPNCQQHILADEGYAGMKISCPACQNPLIVPGTPPAAVPLPVPAAYSYAPAPIPRGPAPASISAPPAPAPIGAAPAPRSASGGCPSCGAALPRGAVICTQCGYNTATGQRTAAGRPGARRIPAAQQEQAPWYKTAYPYIGVVVVVLAVLYFLGKDNPPMMMAFIGTALLYTFTAHIIVVISAFRESVGTGFLTLCVPFYALYYVFSVSENDTLKLLYASAVVINISLKFLAM